LHEFLQETEGVGNMLRKIIKIDEEKCNGCGACATACHEDAIAMVDGKAKLIKDDYCDGLGNCLPACPTGAITFEEREAAAFDEEAVKARQQAKQQVSLPCGCPGTASKTLERTSPCSMPAAPAAPADTQSELMQWPVQIKLVPVNAPYFANANLLIAADCTAFAYGDFHNRFIKNHITLIGCPKLDDGDYTEKLTAILKNNMIKSVTVVRMEVPCCGGIENAVINALRNSGKMIPWQSVTISTDGKILE
jgi:ferredoxin